MFVRNSDVRPVEMLKGVVRRTLAIGEKMMVVQITIEKGSAVPRHKHPHEQVGYLAEGRMKLTIGGETAELIPGDSYHIPPNIEHSATAIEALVAVDIFCPPREDYMD